MINETDVQVDVDLDLEIHDKCTTKMIRPDGTVVAECGNEAEWLVYAHCSKCGDRRSSKWCAAHYKEYMDGIPWRCQVCLKTDTFVIDYIEPLH